jgi:Family of unknown function (DUF6064)
MSEWWTYRIGDFLLFSRATYMRLFERYHADIWPLQLLAIAAGIVILVLAGRRRGGRAIAAILSVAWLWVAWAFHLERYAQINFAATYFAAAFVVEAVLLIWIGVIADRLQPSRLRFGVPLFLFALVVMPALPRHEVFGITPDPTALATIGVIIMSGGKLRWLLLIVPLLWCAVSGATLWSMGAPDALVLPVATVLAIVFAIVFAIVRRR